MLVGYLFVKSTLSPVKTNHAKYLMQINMVKPFKLVCRKKNQQRRLEHRLRNSFRQILMRTRRIKTVNFLMAKLQSRTKSMYLRLCTKYLYYFLGCRILIFWNHVQKCVWYFPFGLSSILQISGKTSIYFYILNWIVFLMSYVI